MRKTWEQFNKLMKKGRTNKVVKAAGFKRKKNGSNPNTTNNSNL